MIDFDSLLFFIIIGCFIALMTYIILSFAALVVWADDTESDFGLCYRHYKEACDRLDKITIESLLNETKDWWDR